jgi:hypothetical protein
VNWEKGWAFLHQDPMLGNATNPQIQHAGAGIVELDDGVDDRLPVHGVHEGLADLGVVHRRGVHVEPQRLEVGPVASLGLDAGRAGHLVQQAHVGWLREDGVHLARQQRLDLGGLIGPGHDGDLVE